MKSCERYETLLSTWVDGQLDREGQVECLDHVVRCEACRGFYLDARALDGWVAAVRTPAEAAPPPAEVWKRIEWVTRADRRRRAGWRVPARALQAAAVFVVAVGLGVAVWSGRVVPAPEQAEVLLGQGTDMTATRFVELTREVLRADPRYHSAMYEVMEQVVRDTTANEEGSPEGLTQRSEERDVTESNETTARIPA